MITIPELVAQALGSFLDVETRGRFGASHAALAEFLPYSAKLTLECIGNSDALYHNIEHSMLVTLVGHDILVGRALQRATTAGDYADFIMACLTHDIGYVSGIVHGDENAGFVADVTGRPVRLPTGASDVALAPYHVDRSKLFVACVLTASKDWTPPGSPGQLSIRAFPTCLRRRKNWTICTKKGASCCGLLT